MTGPRPRRSLQRRLVASYLLFCLVAVAWLAAGVLTTAQSVLHNRTTGACLARLGQLAASMEIDQLRHSGANLQSLTERAQKEGRLLYCCIVGSDGRYIAHTTRPLVGAPASEPRGKRLHWGNIDGVQYADVQSRLVSEYRIRLTANSDQLGTLRLAVAEPDFWNVASEVAQTAPLNVLLPLLCVGVGAFVVWRTAKPVADVENLLAEVARAPSDAPLPLEPTSTHGAATAGWNRLVAYVRDLEQQAETNNGDAKLVQALASRQDAAPRKVLDSLRDGIAVTDAEGRINFANAAIESLLQQEELGKEADATLLENLIAADGDTANASDARRNAPTVVEVGAPGDADSRMLRVERQPIAGDATEGHVWCVRDVTQQNLAQKSRNEFIDAATHELRTPLANIKAYAETLATCDFNDTEQQKGFCNTINAEATRLARFVDDLLDISSLEVGTLSAQRQNVDLERLLNEAGDKVRPLMVSRSLKFDQSIGPKLGELRLDKDKVSAMVVNLLGNAAKYTPHEGEVALKATAGANNITIEVTDNGVGIAEDEQAKVFEKFFRSENPAVIEQSGTGLGLPLAREIARLHGGDITLASKLGEGSTFTITLPRDSGRLS